MDIKFSAMNHEEESEISVLLADDHPGIISGIRHELASEQDILLNASVSNSSDLIRRLEEEDFDVLVSDYSMPKGGYGDGLQLFSYISRKFPQVGLVVLTMLDNPAILQALTQVSGSASSARRTLFFILCRPFMRRMREEFTTLQAYRSALAGWGRMESP